MILVEPARTAVLLVAFGALTGVSVLFSRASGRFGVPATLLFLGIGMLAGAQGLGALVFGNYSVAFTLGLGALVLILFDGGLNTSKAVLRPAVWPASVLATLGVAGTAALVGVGARLFGFSWNEALLLGAVVSSTDAAAVFSVLRGSGLQLKRRVGVTLELESGLNDPMAVILTLALTASLSANEPVSWRIIPNVIVQLLLGGALGVGFGWGARLLLRRAYLPAAGLYPVLTLAIALLVFGLTTLLGGSGFLAVYLAGVVLGNGPLPYRSGLLRVHDSVAWLSQIAMFLVMGLLVVPSHLVEVAGIGFGLALLLAFIARPLVVALCLAPFRYSWRETAFVGWVGLRGAVPVVLAIFPVLAHAPGAMRIFDVVFFVVAVSALIPGGTVRFVTRKLGLESREPPAPPAVLEIASTRVLKGEVLSFFIEPASAVSGSAISQLPFPGNTVVMLVIRGEELVAPKGSTVLEPGDHVYVFCAPEDRALVQLMFGRLEQD
jgi:cell volume regulation protein A